jgi:hypothetical protein
MKVNNSGGNSAVSQVHAASEVLDELGSFSPESLFFFP